MRPGNWQEESCTLELNEPSAARAAKDLPALTVFIPRDSSVRERSAVKGGGPPW